MRFALVVPFLFASTFAADVVPVQRSNSSLLYIAPAPGATTIPGLSVTVPLNALYMVVLESEVTQGWPDTGVTLQIALNGSVQPGRAAVNLPVNQVNRYGTVSVSKTFFVSARRGDTITALANRAQNAWALQQSPQGFYTATPSFLSRGADMAVVLVQIQ